MNVLKGFDVGIRVGWVGMNVLVGFGVGIRVGWVGMIVVPSTGEGVGCPGRFMPGQTV